MIDYIATLFKYGVMFEEDESKCNKVGSEIECKGTSMSKELAQVVHK